MSAKEETAAATTTQLWTLALRSLREIAHAPFLDAPYELRFPLLRHRLGYPDAWIVRQNPDIAIETHHRREMAAAAAATTATTTSSSTPSKKESSVGEPWIVVRNGSQYAMDTPSTGWLWNGELDIDAKYTFALFAAFAAASALHGPVIGAPRVFFVDADVLGISNDGNGSSTNQQNSRYLGRWQDIDRFVIAFTHKTSLILGTNGERLLLIVTLAPPASDDSIVNAEGVVWSLTSGGTLPNVSKEKIGRMVTVILNTCFRRPVRDMANMPGRGYTVFLWELTMSKCPAFIADTSVVLSKKASTAGQLVARRHWFAYLVSLACQRLAAPRSDDDINGCVTAENSLEAGVPDFLRTLHRALWKTGAPHLSWNSDRLRERRSASDNGGEPSTYAVGRAWHRRGSTMNERQARAFMRACGIAVVRPQEVLSLSSSTASKPASLRQLKPFEGYAREFVRFVQSTRPPLLAAVVVSPENLLRALRQQRTESSGINSTVSPVVTADGEDSDNDDDNGERLFEVRLPSAATFGSSNRPEGKATNEGSGNLSTLPAPLTTQRIPDDDETTKRFLMQAFTAMSRRKRGR